MKRLATPGWLLCHVVMIALVVTFLRLGWWQLSRAEGGNGLSIGYTMEWPLFAAFVVAIWLREVRVTLRGYERPAKPPVGRGGPVDVPDGVSSFDLEGARAERAARTAQGADAATQTEYNKYLAWLAEHPNARFTDYQSAQHQAAKQGAPAHE